MSLKSGMLYVDGKMIRDPSAMTYGLMDISAANAGRTEDATMYKARVGQKRKITLQWNMISPSDASEILKAFNPEYFSVKYHDVMENEFQTRTFYAGDRTAPYQMWTDPKTGKVFSSVSFDIIEQ